ncbi:MAG TPA: hypothetical protein VH593_17275, partial [Ktedonobacteraceae bacterium]
CSKTHDPENAKKQVTPPTKVEITRLESIDIQGSTQLVDLAKVIVFIRERVRSYHQNRELLRCPELL